MASKSSSRYPFFYETLFSSVVVHPDFVVKTLKPILSSTYEDNNFLPFDQQCAFLNERACLEALAGFRVPKLIDSNDSGRWIKMENVGQTLGQWKNSAELMQLSSSGLLHLLADIASALAEVHDMGIVHGDFRDENICVRIGDQQSLATAPQQDGISAKPLQVSLIDFSFAIPKGHAIKPPPYDWSDEANKWMSKRAKNLSEASWSQFSESIGMKLIEYMQLAPSRRLELYVATASSVTYPSTSLDWTADLFSFGELIDALKTNLTNSAADDTFRLDFLEKLIGECRLYDAIVPNQGVYRDMHAVARDLRRVADSVGSEALAVLAPFVSNRESSVDGAHFLNSNATQPPNATNLIERLALRKVVTETPVRGDSTIFYQSAGTEPPKGTGIPKGEKPSSTTPSKAAPRKQQQTMVEDYRPTPNFESLEADEPPVLTNRFLSFLYFLSGAETREMYRLPDAASKAKYVSVGLMMIGVSCWAMWSAYHFYLQTVETPSWLTAAKGVLLAMCWGLFVLVIEKAFISTVPTTLPEASDSRSDRVWFYIRYGGAVAVRLLIALGIGTMLTLMSLTVIFKPEIDSAINARTRAQILAADELLSQRPESVNAQQAVTAASTARGRAASDQQRAATELASARARQLSACKGDNRRQLNNLLNRTDLTKTLISERNRLQGIRSRCESASTAVGTANKAEGQARTKLDTAENTERTSITDRQNVSVQVAQGELATTLAEGRRLDSVKSFGRALVGLGFLLQKNVLPANSGSASLTLSVVNEYERMQSAAIKLLIVPLVMLFLGIEVLVLIARLLGRPLVDSAVSYRDRSILKHLKKWYDKQHP